MSVKLSPTITMWNRRDWGAEEARAMTSQASSAIHEAFLHHSSDRTAEFMDTLAEQKAIMRGFQRFHMHDPSRMWSDIGYHYVVFQPWGNRDYARVFQGRLPTYVPAAQEGHNAGTLAVCVVGNFQGDDPLKRNTRHAIELILGRHQSLRTVGGHRDAPGQSTDCPGDTFHAQIPTIAKATRLALYRRPGLQ